MTMCCLLFNAVTIFKEIFPSWKNAAAPVIAIMYGLVLRMFFSTHGHMIFFDEYDRFKIVKLWLGGIFNYPLINDFPGPMMAYLPFYKIFGATPVTGYGISIAPAGIFIPSRHTRARCMTLFLVLMDQNLPARERMAWLMFGMLPREPCSIHCLANSTAYFTRRSVLTASG